MELLCPLCKTDVRQTVFAEQVESGHSQYGVNVMCPGCRVVLWVPITNWQPLQYQAPQAVFSGVCFVSDPVDEDCLLAHPAKNTGLLPKN